MFWLPIGIIWTFFSLSIFHQHIHTRTQTREHTVQIIEIVLDDCNSKLYRSTRFSLCFIFSCFVSGFTDFLFQTICYRGKHICILFNADKNTERRSRKKNTRRNDFHSFVPVLFVRSLEKDNVFSFLLQSFLLFLFPPLRLHVYYKF